MYLAGLLRAGLGRMNSSLQGRLTMVVARGSGWACQASTGLSCQARAWPALSCSEGPAERSESASTPVRTRLGLWS